jgi:hypothetical protein
VLTDHLPVHLRRIGHKFDADVPLGNVVQPRGRAILVRDAISACAGKLWKGSPVKGVVGAAVGCRGALTPHHTVVGNIV